MQPHCTPPGERTLFSLLCAAMQPLGTTLYVYGGGWNLDDTGAGREAVTPFPSPAWKTFFLSQDEGYDYRRFRGSGCNPWHSAGLDCSGYLGWVIYAALHRKSGLEGYVYPSTEMAGALAARGLGRLVRPPCRFLPGDLFSMEGHIWLCVGVCRDESLVIAEDWLFNYKVSKNISVQADTDKRLYHYESAPDSLMSRLNDKKIIDRISVLEYICGSECGKSLGRKETADIRMRVLMFCAEESLHSGIDREPWFKREVIKKIRGALAAFLGCGASAKRKIKAIIFAFAWPLYSALARRK